MGAFFCSGDSEQGSVQLSLLDNEEGGNRVSRIKYQCHDFAEPLKEVVFGVTYDLEGPNLLGGR